MRTLSSQLQNLVGNNKVNLLLVRHGQTTPNLSRQLAGWTDSRLTIRGREQANQLLPQLFGFRNRFKTISSSDLKRAHETALISLGFPEESTIHIDKRLRELNFGEHEGLAFEMLEKEFQDKVFTFDYIAPKGESWRDVKIRAEDFIQDKIREKGLHVAFTHGGLICSLTYDFGLTTSIGNCSSVGLEICESTGKISKLLFHQPLEQDEKEVW